MNSKDVAAKREALEELIMSAGWNYFWAHVLTEWHGPGYIARMRIALSKDDLLEPKVVDRVAQELTRLLQWPGNQVGELKGSGVDE